MLEMIAATSLPSKKVIPGPTELATGDNQAGYYGLVPSNEFISYSDFAQAVGLSGLANNGSPWIKMSYKGNIIFHPQKPTHSGVTMAAINSLGLTYGAKEITILGVKYSIRTMAVMVTEPYGGGGAPGGAAIRGTEYTDLLCRMCNVVTNTEVGDKLGAFTLTELGISSMLTRSAGTSGRAVVVGTPTDITWIDRVATNSGRVWRPVLTVIG